MKLLAIGLVHSMLLKPTRVPRFAKKQDVLAPNMAINHNLLKFD
jgi:hypothetical protein